MSLQPSRTQLITFLLLNLLVLCIGCARPDSKGTATADAQRILTEIHGVEVENTIAGFESKWFSLDAHKEPSIQSELATGRYLDYMGLEREKTAPYNEPFWLVTKSAAVKKVRVLEYNPQRFRAVACVEELTDETTNQGVFEEVLPPYRRRGVYVFVRESDIWKLAGYFNISIPDDVARDWDDAPEWLRSIIVDVPRDMDIDCLSGRQ